MARRRSSLPGRSSASSPPPISGSCCRSSARSEPSCREERRRITGDARQLLAVERDAETGQARDGEIALAVERERRLGDAVDIGAAADELDKIDIGQCRGELEIGGDAERRVPAMADI